MGVAARSTPVMNVNHHRHISALRRFVVPTPSLDVREPTDTGQADRWARFASEYFSGRRGQVTRCKHLAPTRRHRPSIRLFVAPLLFYGCLTCAANAYEGADPNPFHWRHRRCASCDRRSLKALAAVWSTTSGMLIAELGTRCCWHDIVGEEPRSIDRIPVLLTPALTGGTPSVVSSGDYGELPDFPDRTSAN